MPVRRLGPGVLLSLLLVAAPAHAETWSSPDPGGDATVVEFDPEPEPCGTITETPTTEGDVRRLTVRHSRDDVVLTVAVTGLVRAGAASASFTVLTPGRDLFVDVYRYAGRTRIDLAELPRIDEDDVDECGSFFFGAGVIPCPRARGEIAVKESRIRVTLPRRCLGTPRWVRVGVGVCSAGCDTWAPAGTTVGFFRPVGRRVHAGPRP